MMVSFDRRPLAPGDAGDWAALLTAIQDADGSDEYASEQDLQEAFGNISPWSARARQAGSEVSPPPCL